jgi:ferredoxin-NADP reductase
MKVTFVKSQPEAPNIETFWFQPEKPIDFVAGQFIELTLPHKQVDDRGQKRWFTVSSSPTDDNLSITTRFSDSGSSFKQALRALQPGTVVDMDPPMGDFVLPQDPSVPLVFVAGGMGVTPYHSILKWLADTGEQRPIRFIYAVRIEDDIIFQNTFNAAHVHATIVVSEPSDAWGGERGHLSGEQIIKLTEPAENALVYISGPEPMIENLEKQLLELKIPKNQLVTDFFPGYDPV